MKRLIPILGFVSIVMAIVVEINSNMFVDIRFSIRDIDNELQAEPLTPSQREIISGRIDDIQNAYLAEINRKRNSAKLGFYSLLTNGFILTSVGLANWKKK
jgi:hypothetical protein